MEELQYDAIPGFNPVAQSIWEYIPTIGLDPLSWKPSIDAPSLIILFSWTGANGRHVSKYTMTYQTLFPTTPILVITTSAYDFCFRSSAQKQLSLRPAVERVLSYEDHSSILVHAFSEGGSNKATEFAEAYYTITGTRLPCSALCLDSTPGHPRYLRLCNALQKSLPPNPIFKYTALCLGGALIGVRWGLYYIQGFQGNVISRTRSKVIDERFWDPAAPRCYLYSRDDDLVSWQDVREHAMESLEKGLPVMDIFFENSAHCKHSTEDPDRYWGAVMMTWRRALVREKEMPKWSIFSEQVISVPKRAVVRGGSSISDSDSDRTLWTDSMV